MKKILVLGQTPPPYGGQAIMIKTFLEGNYSHIKLFHIRMSFSKDMDEMGKVKIRKIFHLFLIILKAYWYRVIYNIPILYYPPSGPDKLPVIRDMIILTSTRWLFKKTIFHFHAAGLCEIGPKFSGIFRLFFNLSFLRPDIAIRLTTFNPQDGIYLKAKKEFIIANGIYDNFSSFSKKSKSTFPECTILFVGFLIESKGVLVLLEAVKILIEKKLNFTVKIMGKFESAAFQKKVTQFICNHGINKNVEFLGVLTGNPKYQSFFNSDIFCFPSFFESESFGLVVVEAMQFGKPVVTTKWRGIQALVEDGESGYLVPIKDSQAIADKLELLILNPDLRMRMGRRGRDLYLQHYTDERFQNNMYNCLKSA
jgi:glycosyltransferase involved in cell wall biosynthesis